MIGKERDRVKRLETERKLMTDRGGSVPQVKWKVAVLPKVH